MVRLLVTGHKGYIGAIITPMLLHTGHEVIGLDSDLFERARAEQRFRLRPSKSPITQ